MKNLKLDIAGLTCGSCVRRVQQALTRIDDVNVARIDQRGADLVVADHVDVGDILHAVRGAGYEASVAVSP